MTEYISRAKFDLKYQRKFKGQEFHPSFRCDNYRSFIFGKRCYIGPFCHFDALGGLEIGDFVIVGPHVKIWTYNHDFKSERIPYGSKILPKPVKIGRGAWIGLGVTLLPGSDIGEGAIIGAGSIVKEKIPPFSIARPVYAEVEELKIKKLSGNFYRDT